jgi:hypothetical protein
MHKQKTVLTEIVQNSGMIWPNVNYKPTSWQTQILIDADNS